MRTFYSIRNVSAALLGLAFLLTGSVAAHAAGEESSPFDPFRALDEETSHARVQIIHNSADPAASVVDVYINNIMAIDDFEFRTATPYLDLPAETPLVVAVAPGNSMSAEDAIATFNLNLDGEETYVVIANGVLDPMVFDANPDGRDTAFNLFVKAGAREAGMDPGMVDFFALHGATDAPTVDVIARGVATLVDDAAYGDLTGYLSVPAASYILDVTPGNDNSFAVASFEADLSGLGGGAAVVFASGFLNDAQGEGFGLYAALPSGDVVAFPALTTARVQVIHNAADPAAASVDIYLGDTLAIDDFAFRAATPYLDLPANTEVEIGVAPGNSGGPEDILAAFPVNLLAAETYVVIANGVLDPMMFDANPDGRDTAFNLFVKAGAREAAMDSDMVDLLVFHGATDAPTVDVVPVKGNWLVDNAAYGDYTDYISVDPRIWLFGLADADQTTVLARFRAPLSGLGGGAAVVFAGGFLNDAQGEAFSIFAALPDGSVIDLALSQAIDFAGPLLGGKGLIYEPLSEEIGLGTRSDLQQNFPNPFRADTQISFRLDQAQKVRLQIHDVSGRTVATLVDGNLGAGSYNLPFSGRDLSSGVYYYRLQGENFSQTRKMILSQ